MAAVTFASEQNALEGGFAGLLGIITSATAADTLDLTGYLQGRTIVNLECWNISDGAAVPITESAGTATIGAGPSTDQLSVKVTLMIV